MQCMFNLIFNDIVVVAHTQCTFSVINYGYYWLIKTLDTLLICIDIVIIVDWEND